MEAIEVFYELKNSVDFFIASPSEILADGFPYDKIIPRMTEEEVDLKGICSDFYNYYNQKKLVPVRSNYSGKYELFRGFRLILQN